MILIQITILWFLLNYFINIILKHKESISSSFQIKLPFLRDCWRRRLRSGCLHAFHSFWRRAGPLRLRPGCSSGCHIERVVAIIFVRIVWIFCLSTSFRLSALFNFVCILECIAVATSSLLFFFFQYALEISKLHQLYRGARIFIFNVLREPCFCMRRRQPDQSLQSSRGYRLSLKIAERDICIVSFTWFWYVTLIAIFLLACRNRKVSRLTLATSYSTISSDRSFEYSSAITALASSVSLGFMHRAMWMYFLMNCMVRLWSLGEIHIKNLYIISLHNQHLELIE